MNITKHAEKWLTEKADSFGMTPAELNREVMLAATAPTVRYESRRNGGGMRHIRGSVAVIVDHDTVITFYRNVTETPLRPDQTDADALAHAAEVKSNARKVREQARNARRDRDRALTSSLKGKKG